MDIASEQRRSIAEERRSRQGYSVAELPALIESGEGQAVMDSLIFYSNSAVFPDELYDLLATLDGRLDEARVRTQSHYLTFLTDLAIALGSYLPRWNLQNEDRQSEPLTNVRLEEMVDDSVALLSRWEARAPETASGVLTEKEAYASARFAAEAGKDPSLLARKLAGCSLSEYVGNMIAAVSLSNLRQIAVMRDEGRTRTELGNDYAAFLRYTMYLGASFVTCNPVLVDIAWVADTDRWDPIIDGIIAAHPEADQAELARLATLEIVFSNMRLLRPVFLITGGQMGSVSLQVNPKKHGDSETMISEAVSIYEELRVKLEGGVPNVVFKLPGTLAGLEACRDITRRGIGVNITVNFGMFQQLRFAEAIQAGNAIYSCLTEMNGRLAYPVRDELLAKLSELQQHGIDEAKAREAAAWSGVAVVKRLQELLVSKGYDLTKVRPLVASLRIYEGEPGSSRLPTAFPDVSEQVGTGIITVFPNIRHAFDALQQICLNPIRVEEPTPDHVLEVLRHSEIFKQAYYVADPAFVSDDSRFRPACELTLEDEERVFHYPPVYNTLTQFAESYDQFVERILARKEYRA